MSLLNCFVVVLVCALSLTSPVWSICDTLEHIDKTYAIDIQYFGNRAQKAISTDAVYKEDCGQYEKVTNAMTEFIANCVTSIPKEMGNIFINSLKAHYNKRCNDPAFAAEFMEHNKCFEDATKFEKLHICADRWYYQMQAIKSLKQDVTEDIKASCCTLHDFQKCVRETNINECHDKHVAFWDALIDEVTDDHKDQYCANLKNYDECQANYPADKWAAINGPLGGMDAAALKDRTGKYKSTFFTVVDMAANYKL